MDANLSSPLVGIGNVGPDPLSERANEPEYNENIASNARTRRKIAGVKNTLSPRYSATSDDINLSVTVKKEYNVLEGISLLIKTHAQKFKKSRGI